MMPEKIKILLSFNECLHNLIDTKLQSDINGESNKTLFITFVIGKAYKTNEAIMLLCKNGYGEDAFMLTRTLFELMAIAAYILQDKSEDRLMRYMNHDWVIRKRMYDYVKETDAWLAGFNQKIKFENSIIDEIEKKSHMAMEKYKYDHRKGWSDKSIQEMCKLIGRSDMYSTVYFLQCMVSHTNARSMNDYINLIDQEVILNIGPNWNLAERSLVIAFDCFLRIAKETDKQFAWELDDTLEDIARRWDSKVGQL